MAAPRVCRTELAGRHPPRWMLRAAARIVLTIDAASFPVSLAQRRQLLARSRLTGLALIKPRARRDTARQIAITSRSCAIKGLDNLRRTRAHTPKNFSQFMGDRFESPVHLPVKRGIGAPPVLGLARLMVDEAGVGEAGMGRQVCRRTPRP